MLLTHAATVHKYIRKVFHNDIQGGCVTKKARPVPGFTSIVLSRKNVGDYIICNIHFESQNLRLVPYSVLGAFAQQISQLGGFRIQEVNRSDSPFALSF